MKLLPAQHRVAHLRALIRQQPTGSDRRRALAALLQDEMATRPETAGCVA
jgi:hypothetical protein